MKLRIALWAAVGLVISVCWFVFATLRTVPLIPAGWVWTLAKVSQPILLTDYSRTHPLYFYWVFLSNLMIYALIGLAFEGMRYRIRHVRHA